MSMETEKLIGILNVILKNKDADSCGNLQFGIHLRISGIKVDLKYSAETVQDVNQGLSLDQWTENGKGFWNVPGSHYPETTEYYELEYTKTFSYKKKELKEPVYFLLKTISGFDIIGSNYSSGPGFYWRAGRVAYKHCN